jgi:dienelactone hydrolase
VRTSHAGRSSAVYGVGIRNETFVDKTRPTSSHNGVPGAATRTLRTIVLYPTLDNANDAPVPDAAPAPRSFPLVVVVHGASTGPAANVPVLEQLAAAGYVVAMPKFPLTGEDTVGGPDPADYVNEPADISFVIDRLLRLTKDPRSVYHGKIRPHHVAVLGLSLGASAAVAVGYGTCCIDERVDAVVAVSGAKAFPGLPAFPGTYSYPPTPLLLVRGTPPSDFAASFSEPIFAEAHAPKFLLTVTNGQHVPLLADDPGGRTSLRAVIAFFDRYLESRHHALDVLLDQGQDPSIATLRAVTR